MEDKYHKMTAEERYITVSQHEVSDILETYIRKTLCVPVDMTLQFTWYAIKDNEFEGVEFVFRREQIA